MIYFTSACALLLGFLLLRANQRLRVAAAKLQQAQDESTSRLEKQNKAHDREIQHLLDALPSPFFSVNEKGILIRVNRGAREIFSSREILNRSIQQVFLDTTIVTFINEGLESPEPHHRVLQFPPGSVFSSKSGDKDSSWEVDISPLSLQSNSLEIQVMMRDITASVHADQVRKDFVANASHELRTPLSIISGYLENLTEEGGLDNKDIAQKMLETMDRHVVRINRIVEDMLVISKLESDDAAPLNLAPFNLAVCVRDIVERLELVIEKQQAVIELNIPEIEIIGDHFYWTQILFNLVENALKQNPNIPLKVCVEITESKHDLTISITDNGIGIPAVDLPFIFKRFYRVEKHHSQTQIKGTGLGLSIVKRAIEAHGGTIGATSTPGVETAFIIKAPKSPPQFVASED